MKKVWLSPPVRYAGSKTRGLVAAAIALTSLASICVAAQEKGMLDCPMRDSPHSVDMPFIDILASQTAMEIVRRHVPDVMKLPEFMLKREAPAFGAIVTLRQLASTQHVDPQAIARLNDDLAGLEVTDADRRARCARYDDDTPQIDVPGTGTRVLVFEKINGFDHGPTVGAATAAIERIAEAAGWFVTVTDKGGAFAPGFLAHFDAVVWNNNSGDVLTLSQRNAFENYILGGGGYLGIHGAGGDSAYFWGWYADEMIAAQFIGHPMDPQFQEARIQIEDTGHGIGESLEPGWIMSDEWYSFAESPRRKGATIVAALDESTYDPGTGFTGEDLRMGDDHPIVWTRCVGDGRAMYSAIGHRPEVYEVPQYETLLSDGLNWVTGNGASVCPAE